MATSSAGGNEPADGRIDPRFAGVGLTATAMAVYEYMLGDDGWSLATLPTRLGLDREDVTAALDELEDAALIVRGQDSPTIRVVSPQVGLNRLVDARDVELRQKQDDLVTARRATERLIAKTAEQDAARSRMTLEVLSSGPEVASRVSEALDAAKTSVLTMLTVLPSPEALAYAATGDEALLRRGIQTRMLVLAGHLSRSPELVAHVERLTGLGADVRVATMLPMRVIVVDGELAILPADMCDEAGGALFVRHPTLVSLALETFETAWFAATPPEHAQCAETPSWRPSQMQDEVLRLLAAGDKDDSIARRLQVSSRTVRRLISEASEELEVESRFQLAVEVARRKLV